MACSYFPSSRPLAEPGSRAHDLREGSEDLLGNHGASPRAFKQGQDVDATTSSSRASASNRPAASRRATASRARAGARVRAPGQTLSRVTSQLHVYTHEGIASASDLQAAIKRYYESLALSTRLNLRERIRFGEIALLVGVAVFSFCVSARGVLQSRLHGLPRGLDEGLIILAWIALWRPVEMLAYGWVPLYRRRRLYQRLARVQVLVRVEASLVRDKTSPALESTPVIKPAQDLPA